MKKLLTGLALCAALLGQAASPNVDEKVVKKFEQSFPAATKASWISTEDGHYEVVFLNNNVSCRICYDTEGRIMKTTRYYKADGLPPYLLAKVQQRYPTRTIFGVTEISTESGVQYHLVLEDATRWYDVMSDSGGNFMQVKRMRKA